MSEGELEHKLEDTQAVLMKKEEAFCLSDPTLKLTESREVSLLKICLDKQLEKVGSGGDDAKGNNVILFLVEIDGVVREEGSECDEKA